MTNFKIAIEALEQDKEMWKVLVKENQSQIDFFQRTIQEIKEGKDISGYGPYRFVRMDTDKEKIDYIFNEIAELDQEIKKHKENLNVLKKAQEILTSKSS